MKAQELRIGNHVLLDYGEFRVVRRVVSVSKNMDENHYEGIPIDTDFCKENVHELRFNRGADKLFIVLRKDSLGDIYTVLRIENFKTIVSEIVLDTKYVHQLENLFYAFTGRMPEFTFKYLNK